MTYPKTKPSVDFRTPRKRLVSQVRAMRVPLVCLDLALSPEDWRWLRWQAEGRAP